MLDGHRFGGHPFEFHGAPSDFYSAYFLGWLLGIGAALSTFLAIVVGAIALGPQGQGNEILTMIWRAGTVYIAVFVSAVFIMARLTNVGYNRTRFGSVGFRSTIRARDMLWIYVSNTACILLSVGLLVPWAQIRLARYRAQHIELVGAGDLESFRAELSPERFAGGAETASVFDVDVSL